MIRIFKTMEGKVQKIPAAEEGSWVAMTNPTQEELISISEQFLIDLDELAHNGRTTGKGILSDDSFRYLYHRRKYHHRMSGGYTDSCSIYGRQDAEFQDTEENPFSVSDALPQCFYVPAVSAYR